MCLNIPYFSNTHLYTVTHFLVHSQLNKSSKMFNLIELHTLNINMKTHTNPGLN